MGLSCERPAQRELSLLPEQHRHVRTTFYILYQALHHTGTRANTLSLPRYEVACEPNDLCNVDQLSFKAYLSRWMAATTKVAPWTADQILPLLASSAQAAAQSCSGGTDGNMCGTKWTQAGWDGTYGVGQQMSALEVIQSNLIKKVAGPVSNSTGGTSQGNPSAGTGTSTHVDNAPGVIGTKDKAGAGVLTAVVLAMLLGGGYVSVSAESYLLKDLLIFLQWMSVD
jgi:mannan endo-1,6-alpha-mannosidase